MRYAPWVTRRPELDVSAALAGDLVGSRKRLVAVGHDSAGQDRLIVERLLVGARMSEGESVHLSELDRPVSENTPEKSRVHSRYEGHEVQGGD